MAEKKTSVAAKKPADSKSKAKAAPSPNQKPSKSRGSKTHVLVKPIDAIFDREDETSCTFFAEDVGLSYDDSDPAVARAVELYPDHFA